MTIVRWRYADETHWRVESFPSKASAQRWIKSQREYAKRHPDEAAKIIEGREPNPRKRKASDLLRDMETPRVLGYELDRETFTPKRSYTDTSKQATVPPTQEDRRLLAQYGSLEALEAAGFYGSADKLRNERKPNPRPSHSGHMATCRHCEALTRKYEREGMTTSDAQGAAEAQHMRAGPRAERPRSDVEERRRLWNKIVSGKALTKREEERWKILSYADTDYPTRSANPAREPTIYEALRSKLGREPTNAELRADVERIKREAVEGLARKGKLPHQRRLFKRVGNPMPSKSLISNLRHYRHAAMRAAETKDPAERAKYVRAARMYNKRLVQLTGQARRASNPARSSRKRANDLTAEAMEGYTGAPLKYIYSSPNWYAYKIGEYFRQTGRPEPSDVRMGRGYSINVRDMTFSFGKGDAITRVK